MVKKEQFESEVSSNEPTDLICWIYEGRPAASGPAIAEDEYDKYVDYMNTKIKSENRELETNYSYELAYTLEDFKRAVN